jgi:hypothetical protein
LAPDILSLTKFTSDELVKKSEQTVCACHPNPYMPINHQQALEEDVNTPCYKLHIQHALQQSHKSCTPQHVYDTDKQRSNSKTRIKLSIKNQPYQDAF